LVERERFGEAADAYASADRLESNAEWRERSRTLREEARLAALPKEFRHVATATALSRGDVAAFIGVNLSSVIDRAPARVTAVATDIRDHWAAPWILPVTRAGIMTIFP